MRSPWTRRIAGVATAVAALVSGTPSAAQEGRVFIEVNAAAQTTSTNFTDNVVFTEFVEEGDFDGRYDIDSGFALDVAGGIVLWRGIGVGVGYTRFDRDDDAHVEARIPHPFFFSRPRTVEGDPPGLKRTEHGVHVQARWFPPVPGPLELAVFGGPTFFNVTQDLVTAVGFTDSFPFNSASFTAASTRRQSEWGFGYNVGADVGFFFSRHVGVGALARFSSASFDLVSQDSGLVPIDIGGLHLGGGLRLRF